MARKDLQISILFTAFAILTASGMCLLGSCTVLDGVLEQLGELKGVIGEFVEENPMVFTV